MPAIAQPRPEFDIRRFGARCDGETDDAAALEAAWDAMVAKGGGTYAAGLLVIPDRTYVGSAVVLDGGHTSVATTSASDWAQDTGRRVTVRCDGPIVCPTSTVGTIIKAKGLMFPRLDMRFHGGGHANDNALVVEDVNGLDLSVDAHECAATILHMSGTDNADKVRNVYIRKLHAVSCGRALHLVGVEGFGLIGDVWDVNSSIGSLFDGCSDVGIMHWETFNPASQTYGLHFLDCNSFNVHTLSIGDRPAVALVRIEGGDFGRVIQIRASGNHASPRNTIGVQLVDVASIQIDTLQTFRCSRGLEITGGGSNKITVQRHQSLTQDGIPLYVTSGTGTAPRIDVGCDYRNCQNEAVKVTSGLTGGHLTLEGWIKDYNVAASGSTYAIDCASSAFVVDVSRVLQETRSTTAGSVNHSDATKVRRVGISRLGNDSAVFPPTVTGSRAGNEALASLLTTLAAHGLIADGTS